MRKFALFIGVLSLLSACSMAASGAFIHANRDLEEGNFDSAIHNATMAEYYYDEPSPEVKRRAALIKARAFEGKGDKDASKAMYQYIYDRYPDSYEGYIAREKLGKKSK